MELILITIGAPLLFSFLISLFLNQRTIEVLPAVYAFAAIWVYLFSIFNLYAFGVNSFLVSVGLISALIVYKKIALIKSNFIKEITSPSVVIFISLSIFLYFKSNQLKFSEWDEFSYWGSSVKSIFYFEQIAPYAPLENAFLDYVPGLPVLSSLFIRALGNWNESVVFWAYQVFIVSLIYSLFSAFRWKQIHLLIFYSILILSSLFFFFSPFNSIYADATLSILFGVLLVMASSDRIRVNSHFRFNFTLLVSFLTLIKEIGIFFAAVCILILLINLLIENLSSSINLLTAVRQTIKEIMPIAVILLVVRSAWNFLLKSREIESTRYSSDLFSNLLPLSKQTVDPFMIESIRNNFYQKLKLDSITQFLDIYLSAYEVFILLSVMLILLSYLKFVNENSITQLIYGFIVFIGFYGYFELLIFLYATSFTPAEANSLASFHRYISSYYSGVTIYLVGSFIQVSFRSSKNLYFRVIYFLLPIFIFSNTGQSKFIKYLKGENSIELHSRNNLSVQSWLINSSNLPPDSNVWVIAQHTTGYDFYVLQYELIPNNVGLIPFSIGSKSGPEDIWTDSTYTPEKWSKELVKFDYVLISNTTQSFIDEFGILFENPSSLNLPGMYEVIKKSSEGIYLIQIR